MPGALALIDRFLHAQRWDEAAAAIDALPAAEDDTGTLRRRRMALAMAGRLAEALDAAVRLTGRGDADAADFQHLAHIQLRLLRTADAFDSACVAIRRDPALVRPYAVAAAAAVLQPDLTERLRALLGPPPQDGARLRTAPRQDRRLRVAIPWRLPAYRAFSGPHPVITSALGPGSRIQAQWADADAPFQPARVLALLPSLRMWAEGAGAERRAAIADFLVHRLPYSLYAAPDADVAFHHTVPFALDGSPWLFHLEHPNMVAAPMVTYPTAVLRPGDDQVSLLRDRLLDPACIGVFTHIRETKRRLDRLIDVPAVAAKTAYIRLGIDLAPAHRPVRAPAVRRRTTTLLFTNSLARDNFHVRGGPDVLRAFLDLHGRYGNTRLLMRSGLPEAGAERLIGRSRRHPAVTWITDRLSDADIDALYTDADLFLLPSGLLHAVSILRALRAGLALVASDVYGVDEFVRHGINGVVVPGRNTPRTPRGAEDAVYAEDCRGLLYPGAEPPDPLFQFRFRAAVGLLLDNPRLTSAIRSNARRGAALDHRGHRWAAEVSDFIQRRWDAAARSSPGAIFRTCPEIVGAR